MSSVGGSGGSDRSDEVVRKAREDYRKKESDLIKKHQKEMQKVEEANERKVSDLKQSQDKQIGRLQKDSRETITARDHKYQKEIDDLRTMHRRQLQQAVEENQQTQQKYSSGKKLETNQMREQNDSRLRDLQDGHAQEIQKKTQEFQNNLQEMNEEQKGAIKENRNKLEQKHQERITDLVETREKDIAELQEKFNSYKRSAENKIEDLEVRSFKDRTKASNEVINNIRRERMTHTDNLAAAKEGYDSALEKTRERYEKANSLRGDQQEEFRKEMNKNVEDRVMSKIYQLESDKADAKVEQTLLRAQMKRQNDKEIENLRQDFNRNIEGYEMDRREALDMSNQRNAENMRVLTNKHNQVFGEAMKRNLNDKTAAQYRNQNAVQDIQKDFGARVEQQKIQADIRVKNIYDQTEEGKARAYEQHKEEIEAMKFNQGEEIKALRKQMEDDKRAVVDNLKDQMRKQEVSHTEKNALLVQKYEKQIATLNDQLNKERRDHDDYVRRTIAGMQQEQKLQLEAQDNKFSERARQMQERHAEELKSESKRHQVKTEQLLQTIKKG